MSLFFAVQAKGMNILRVLVRPFLFIFQFLYRVFWSGLNEKSLIQLVVSFWINFAPVFIWLMIFKNAGLIPKKIRPPIHVKLAMNMDIFMFDFMKKPIGSLITLTGLAAVSWLLYKKFYRPSAYAELSSIQDDNSFEMSSGGSSDLEDQVSTIDLAKYHSSTPSAPGDFQDDVHHGDLVFFHKLSHRRIAARTAEINRKIVEHLQTTGLYRPYNCWHLSPILLTAASWVLLNIAHYFRVEVYTAKDLFAWASYVLGHFFVPLFTAIWLYVFHAPGALKLFSFGLGMQNIAGVLTHLLLPTAPPWFIHLKGENLTANYDMPGYAAGLTRIDVEMGTHLHSKGFHASPIVFGAVPSLHSAMAVMAFYFVSYYSRWSILKIMALSFVCIQWWATIYLDHHWRLDLIVGMFYSLVAITILRTWSKGFNKVDKDFLDARLRFDFIRGSTMGMRVFRNTRLQSFFDPLS